MKRKGLILVLIALVCLLFVSPSNNNVDAAASGEWTLVTNASTLSVGDKVIIAAKDSNYALSTTQNGNNRGQAAVTKKDSIVSWNSSVQELTLKAGKTSGTFAFYTGNGYLYAASSSNNYLRTETTLSANSSWTISITSTGVATVKATGSNTRSTMQYNSSSSIFACYSSASQKAICIYKFVESQEPNASIENKTSDRIFVDTTYQLNIKKENFIDGTKLTYQSSDIAVARVTSDGLIEAVAPGETTISVLVDGKVNDSFTLTVYSYASDLQNLVIKYYNNGVYTKKSEIYLTDDAQGEIAQYFHGTVDTARTTYYNGNYLLMANFDGSLAKVDEKNNPIDGINSGYRTDGSDMKHFVYKDGNVVDTYKVVGTSIADYYIALDDMIVNGFFDKWDLVGGKYVYNVPVVQKDENDKPLVDEMLHNFLWFAAPCLEDSVFGNPDGNHYIMAEGIKLVVEEKSNNYYGNYLSLQIVLAGDDVTKSNNNGILAEARVYKENEIFDENEVKVATSLAKFEFGANVTANPTHKDTTNSQATYTEKQNGYTLSITGADKFYSASNDEKGNSCIKLGATSAAAKFTFTVPDNVTKVVIYIAGYKGNSAKIDVNGNSYTITTLSNNGAYTAIEVDTSVNKTVNFATVSGGYRAMLNTIEFIGYAQ